MEKTRQTIYIMLTALLILFLTVSGCSFSVGGNNPQKKPDSSKEDIKKSVQEEMASPETKKLVEDATKNQSLEELLKAPDADKLIQKAVSNNIGSSTVSKQINIELTKALASPEIQKMLQEHIKKSLETPQLDSALTSAVQKSLMKMLQGGGKDGGQSGGSGGGQ